MNQSVLHYWFHKLVVFKVIGTSCILPVQFLCRMGYKVFSPEVNYPLLGSEKFKQFHLNVSISDISYTSKYIFYMY